MAKASDLLEFEEPLGVLLKEIEALSLLSATDSRDREIAQLRRRVDSMRAEIYAHLTQHKDVLFWTGEQLVDWYKTVRPRK